MRNLPTEPDLRAREILKFPRQTKLSIPGNDYLLVRLWRHERPGCKEQNMQESVVIHDGSTVVEQPDLSIAYSWTPHKEKPVGRSTNYPPQPRTFGRKPV